jgi:hypothetical protein
MGNHSPGTDHSFCLPIFQSECTQYVLCAGAKVKHKKDAERNKEGTSLDSSPGGNA